MFYRALWVVYTAQDHHCVWCGPFRAIPALLCGNSVCTGWEGVVSEAISGRMTVILIVSGTTNSDTGNWKLTSCHGNPKQKITLLFVKQQISLNNEISANCLGPSKRERRTPRQQNVPENEYFIINHFYNIWNKYFINICFSFMKHGAFWISSTVFVASTVLHHNLKDVFVSSLPSFSLFELWSLSCMIYAITVKYFFNM